MPQVSLIVCVYREGELLRRLLAATQGLYADLVVVHDGPDEMNVRELVERAGGRFFVRPRAFQQEPHWPFAWSEARYDWVLRLDADEVPGPELMTWLRQFKSAPEPPEAISGYTCIWPLWDGHRMVSCHWPAGRSFLFHRQRVRFFGMVEQTPVPDGQFRSLDLVLEHRPLRKSYGLANVLVRTQAYRWRACIAASLRGKPTDLECWRWTSPEWPPIWERMRQHPIRTALTSLMRGTLAGLRDQWRVERRIFPFAALSGPVHHALICAKYLQLRRRQRCNHTPGSE